MLTKIIKTTTKKLAPTAIHLLTTTCIAATSISGTAYAQENKKPRRTRAAAYIKATDFNKKLVIAAKKNNSIIVNQLLDNNKHSLNHSHASFATTPLMAAALAGEKELVLNLLKRGAKVDVKDTFGETALAYAINGGHDEIVQILLDHNADPAIISKYRIATQKTVQKTISKKNKIRPIAIIQKPKNKIKTTNNNSTANNKKTTIGPIIGLAAGGAIFVGAMAAQSKNHIATSNNEEEVIPEGEGEITPPPNTQQPVIPTTLPYRNTLSDSQINSTGTGVKVALIDNGVKDATLPAGILDTTNSKDFYDPSTGETGLAKGSAAEINDPNSLYYHGTNNAKIINEIAPQTQIISLRTFGNCDVDLGLGCGADNTSGDTDTRVSNALNHLKNGADDVHASVINMGFGFSEANTGHDIKSRLDDPIGIQPIILRGMLSNTIDSINDLTNLDATKRPVFVFPAGNETDDNPTDTAGLYLVLPDEDPNDTSLASKQKFAKQWVVAVALTETGTGDDATYTVNGRKCGETQARCLGAIANSTSYSASQITAAIAKLISSGLTPTQAAQRVLNTAIYLDENGKKVDDGGTEDNNDTTSSTTNANTGHGLLNSNLATSSLGTTFVNAGNNNSLLFSGSKINSGQAFGNAIKNGTVKFLVFDNFNNEHTNSGSAGFNVRLADFSSLADSQIDAHNIMQTFGQAEFIGTTQLADGEIKFTPYQKVTNDITGKTTTHGKFSFTTTDKNSTTNFNHNVAMNDAFGFGAIDKQPNNIQLSPTSGKNPYLAFAEEGMNIINDIKLSDNTTIRSGLFTGQQQNTANKTKGFVGEVVQDYSSTKLSFQTGYLTEEHSFLGTTSTGAFATEKDTPTIFYGISASHDLNNNLNIHGAYMQGITSPNASQNSLINDISDIRSESFHIGANYNNLLKSNDTFGLSIAQPLRVTSGSLQMSFDSGFDSNGNIIRSTNQLNLTPTGRELDLSGFYQLDLNDNKSSIQASTLHRLNPGHNKNAEAESIFMLRYTTEF